MITVGNTLYARSGLLIDIDGIETVVLSVNSNVCGSGEITVAGIFVVALIFKLKKPVFKYGTPMAANTEITRGRQATEKVTPLIYLLLPSGFIDRSIDSAVIVHDITLYFLDDSRVDDWLVEDHYANVILLMNRLADYVIGSMRNYKGFGDDFQVTGSGHANWGVFKTLKGYIKKIFNINTSGVERSVSLPVYKNCFCK